MVGFVSASKYTQVKDGEGQLNSLDALLNRAYSLPAYHTESTLNTLSMQVKPLLGMVSTMSEGAG